MHTHFSELLPIQSGPDDQLRLAAAAYLARYTGSSRGHTKSDLRCYLTWCTGRSLDPLAARRPHLELCIRWIQEIRRFRPSTVSRRFSVGGRVLPDPCHRRRAGPLPSGACPPPFGAARVTHARVHAPAV